MNYLIDDLGEKFSICLYVLEMDQQIMFGFIVERGKKLFINVLFLGRYHGGIFFPKSLIYDFGRKWGILRVRL